MYCGGEPEHHIRNVTSIYACVMNRTFKPCSWLVYESQVLDTTNYTPR